MKNLPATIPHDHQIAPPPEANHSPSFRRGLGGGPFPFAQRRGLGANRTQGMLATPSQTQRPPSLVFPNEPPLPHLVILNGAKRSEESPRDHPTRPPDRPSSRSQPFPLLPEGARGRPLPLRPAKGTRSESNAGNARNTIPNPTPALTCLPERTAPPTPCHSERSEEQ